MLALLPSLAYCFAQTPADAPHAAWAGYYRMARGADLAGYIPQNLDLDPVIVQHLQPWALMKMEETNGVADDTGAICQIDGIFRVPTTIGSFLWLPTKNEIVVAFAALSTAGVRRIYLNRPHLKGPHSTWTGDSIGHWDGETLLVDTNGFNDKSWLMSGMEPHTEELHVVERIRLVDDGKLMEIGTVVDDRKALTSPYTYSRYYRKVDEQMPVLICNGYPGEQDLWLGFQRHALKKGFKPAAQ
jgi:hypothetical protein